MKIGIEFEMIIVYTGKKIEYIDEIVDNFRYNHDLSQYSKPLVKFLLTCNNLKWDIGDDGSLNIGRFKHLTNVHYTTAEICTIPYGNIQKLFIDLRKVFGAKHIKINSATNEEMATGEYILLSFNKSTGTHIHYSTNSSYKEGGFRDSTIERTYLRDPSILKEMVDYIKNNCKYPSIKKDLFRRDYSQYRFEYDYWTKILSRNRYAAINTWSEHGTLEFRLFNLHGIQQKDFFKALRHLIALMCKSILLANRNKIVKVTKDIADEIEKNHKNLLTEYKKQKIIRSQNMFMLKPLIIE